MATLYLTLEHVFGPAIFRTQTFLAVLLLVLTEGVAPAFGLSAVCKFFFDVVWARPPDSFSVFALLRTWAQIHRRVIVWVPRLWACNPIAAPPLNGLFRLVHMLFYPKSDLAKFTFFMD